MPNQIPLAVDSPAVSNYQAAYKAIKDAMLMVGNARRDTTQIDAALAQIDDARKKFQAFRASHKGAI